MDNDLLGIVIKHLTTFVHEEVATFWGVDQQAQKLTRYLIAIRAVLQDVEEQKVTSHAVKLWVDNLTDAAHALEDIMNQCSVQFDRENIGLCAWLTRFLPKNILFRLDMGKRMKEITQRFDAIDQERRTFELRPSRIIIASQSQEDQWSQTTSVITEPNIYGRDQDRERVVEFLISHANNNEDLSVYPIVGMAGVGKTTLAQLVFNHDGVSRHFDIKVWVCVSNDFKIKRILQSIIESTTSQNFNLLSLESMQKRVQQVLQSKKYLIVLDGVRNEDQVEWNQLKSLLQCLSGTNGASILVTTQLENVATIIGTHPAHHLLHHEFGSDRNE